MKASMTMNPKDLKVHKVLESSRKKKARIDDCTFAGLSHPATARGHLQLENGKNIHSGAGMPSSSDSVSHDWGSFVECGPTITLHSPAENKINSNQRLPCDSNTQAE